MPIPNQVDKVSRSLAREQVYTTLRDWIIEGALEPEETIRDYQLAAVLGVSRTPVREALRRLEDEGLVETAKQRWTRVAPIYAEDADDLYSLVKTLECYALSFAWDRLTPEDFARMEEANTAMANAVHRHDAPAALQADNDFHQVWLERAGNRELVRILRDLKTKLRRMELWFFDSEDAACSLAEHETLLQALHAKQHDAALRALEENWAADTRRFTRRSATTY